MATRFERTLQDIDKRCRKHKIPYAVIGGIAAIIHGSLRVTADIDLTVLAEIDALERVLKIFADDNVCLTANALLLRAPLEPGPATGAVHKLVRESIPMLIDDRVLAEDLAAAAHLISSREVGEL